jgi:hypothetical protein
MGKDDNAVFANALSYFAGLLQVKPRPDIIVIEALLPPTAMKGQTTRAVRDRLAGLHAIVRACATLRGIERIEAVPVGAIRAHFIGDRSLHRLNAKAAVMDKCRMLGWHFENDNEADALALWSYACGLYNAAHSLRVAPLFLRRADPHDGLRPQPLAAIAGKDK